MWRLIDGSYCSVDKINRTSVALTDAVDLNKVMIEGRSSSKRSVAQ